MATTPVQGNAELTAREVAAIIARTPQRVGQLARAGHLQPATAVVGSDGRRWRTFTAAEVGRYLHERDQARST